MSSPRSSWFPIALMAIGAGLLLFALGWGWLAPLLRQEPSATVPVTTTAVTSTHPSVHYRPANSDWWLVLADDSNTGTTALAERVMLTLPQLDPDGPTLAPEWPAPVAIAAAGGLRVLQFPAGTALPLPPSDTGAGRWHLESLADAAVLFWLPGDQHSTAVDRVPRPAAGTGSVRRQWLQARLQWPAESCDALPALLNQLPEHASLHVQQEDGAQASLRWQLHWTALASQIGPLLQSVGAPRAQAGVSDQWFWREADLSSLPRAETCPAASGNAGFVARIWSHEQRWHAALAHPRQRSLRGFPLPLPTELPLERVTLSHASGLSSSAIATAWLQQQSLTIEPGLLLAVQHHRDGEFAGMELLLRSDRPDSLLLQWRWPLP